MNEKELQALKDSVTDTDLLYWKGVLYGEFGVRKTTTALRTSRKRAILLHADRGWHVYKNHPDEFKDENIVPLEYQGLSQVKSLVKAQAENIEPFNDVDLIVLDTVSQMQENYIDFLMENAQYAGNFREKAVPRQGVNPKIFEAAEVPGMPDYHLARNKIRPVVNTLVKAECNVMFLAHNRDPGAIEKAAGKIERRPNVTEALYKVIAREATFIGYMSKKKEEFTVSFESKPTQSAKSQIPALENKLINVNKLPEILWAWQDRMK
jgi:hypothetical protein